MLFFEEINRFGAKTFTNSYEQKTLIKPSVLCHQVVDMCRIKRCNQKSPSETT